jgi:tryptophan 2,3-dioxygenase
MLRPHRGYPDAYAALERGLTEPSIYDDALALLARRGYDIAPEHLHRDLAAPYQPHPSVEAAWLAAYAEQGGGDDLHRLADALTSVADLWKQWRHRHLVTVARVIGHKPGTGGTSGVNWLRRVSELEIFPELWTMRACM